MSDWRTGDKIEEGLKRLTNATDRMSDAILQRNTPTLREHFAGLALSGLLSGSGVTWSPEELAASSVILADALIKALEKTTDGK
jgi:hypothetical protein